MAVIDMNRRLVPCWLVLLEFPSWVLLAAFLISFGFVVSVP